VYPVIADPPFAGAVQLTVSWFTPAVAVGADGVAGTVVIVTEEEGSEAAEVPEALVAVTVNVYAVLDSRPVTVSGELAPVAVYPPGDDVAVKDVAGGESSGKEKDTVAAPSLNGLDVPTSVAVTSVGALGSRKLSCAEDLRPKPFLPAMFYLSFFISLYAERSPITNQLSAARLKSVAEDHCARNLSPGVPFTVTPAAPAIVTSPSPLLRISIDVPTG
jgi:hypothetical protein